MKSDKNTSSNAMTSICNGNNVIAAIHQGDQYYLPFYIENDSAPITPNDIDDIRIKIDNIVKVYSKGGLLYEDNIWLFPISQKNSLEWKGPLECQIQFKQGDNIITSKKYIIQVYASIFNSEF